MAKTNERIDKLEKLKGFLVELTSSKTRLESNGVTFEFSGDLAEGTEVEFIEGSAEELTLEDGRTVKFSENKVTELSADENKENASVEEQVNEIEDNLELEEHGDDETEMEDDDKTYMVEHSVVIESVDAIMDLLGGDGPMNEDAKAEVMGILQSLKDMAAEEADGDMEEDEMEDDEEEVMMSEEVSNRLSAIETQTAELIDSLTKAVEQNVEMKAQIEKLSKSPAVESDEKKTVQTFNKTKTNSRAAQILAS